MVPHSIRFLIVALRRRQQPAAAVVFGLGLGPEIGQSNRACQNIAPPKCKDVRGVMLPLRAFVHSFLAFLRFPSQYVCYQAQISDMVHSSF